MTANSSLSQVNLITCHQLASMMKNKPMQFVIMDIRSFLEFNGCHIKDAVNVSYSKIVKRRLQQDKISVEDFLVHSCYLEIEKSSQLVLYDLNCQDVSCVPYDSFLYLLIEKLVPVFKGVSLLKGGFLEFQSKYPRQCEDNSKTCPNLTSVSQPCLSATNLGPTRVLPFLYLGSQQDCLNKELMQAYNITYIINVSTTCPKPEYVQDSHFLQIPVNDNYSEKILPYFNKTYQFLEKVRESSACALIHCLAGISRSATVAIAYVMRHMKISSEEARRYVKGKRPSISPNFNFLGQLLEYENRLCADGELVIDRDRTYPLNLSSKKSFSCPDVKLSVPRTLSLCLKKTALETVPGTPQTSPQIEGARFQSFPSCSKSDLSPTTALAGLSFLPHSDKENIPKQCQKLNELLDGPPTSFESSMLAKRIFHESFSSAKSESYSFKRNYEVRKRCDNVVKTVHSVVTKKSCIVEKKSNTSTVKRCGLLGETDSSRLPYPPPGHLSYTPQQSLDNDFLSGFPRTRKHSSLQSSSSSVSSNSDNLSPMSQYSDSRKTGLKKICSCLSVCSCDSGMVSIPGSSWYLDNRDICRSDSASTSGLGSEYSDLDNYMEVQSVCDSMAASDDGVFLEPPSFSLNSPYSCQKLNEDYHEPHRSCVVTVENASGVPVTVEIRSTSGRSPAHSFSSLSKDSAYYSLTEPQSPRVSWSHGSAVSDKVQDESTEYPSNWDKVERKRESPKSLNLGFKRECSMVNDAEQAISPVIDMKDERLMRAQSCPGIVDTLSGPQANQISKVGEVEPVKLRKRNVRSHFQDRYSCGNLDLEYSQLKDAKGKSKIDCSNKTNVSVIQVS